MITNVAAVEVEVEDAAVAAAAEDTVVEEEDTVVVAEDTAAVATTVMAVAVAARAGMATPGKTPGINGKPSRM